jgi:hypothetical protein
MQTALEREGRAKGIRKEVGGAGTLWWLWEWLDEEVLRNADRSAAAGL